MSEVTFYIALAFVPSDDGIASGEAIECFNPNSAVMKAEALSRKPGCGGAVAISRSGDPATGDFGDARVRAKVDDLCRERDALREKRSSVARLPAWIMGGSCAASSHGANSMPWQRISSVKSGANSRRMGWKSTWHGWRRSN
jgi:hypothetical protein